MPSHTSSRLFLVTAGIFWSISGVILKNLPDVHWLVIAGMRSLFAAIVFLPGLRQPRLPLAKLLAAILFFAIIVAALMGAMQLGTAAQGIWLHFTAPALVALWVWLVQRQRLRPTEMLAALLTLLAVVLIAGAGGGPAQRASLLLGLISGFAFAAFLLLLKSFGPVPAASVHLWVNLGAALLLLPLAFAFRVPFPTAPRDLALLAAMGMGQLGLGYYFFMAGISGATAVEASLIVLLEPILNPIWVYLLVGELPSPRVITGCALIALGLLAFALTPGRREPPIPDG
jgi:drug/metabolite transporter (DMT)-like permease